jgi:D-alanyl-D-alanine dipeptidase
MDLLEITEASHGVELDIVYATARNVTGKPVYARPAAFLHRDAAEKLARAAELAGKLGYKLRLFDAFRPSEAQWVFWNHVPDPNFFADPRKGSPHSRGVAVDLTLTRGGEPLDMGTGFDALTPLSYHGSTEIGEEAQRNRYALLGIMSTAGWDFYMNEWWHYQLFQPRRYPLLSDSVLARSMMR